MKWVYKPKVKESLIINNKYITYEQREFLMKEYKRLKEKGLK